jgi:hypothetical protein
MRLDCRVQLAEFNWYSSIGSAQLHKEGSEKGAGQDSDRASYRRQFSFTSISDCFQSKIAAMQIYVRVPAHRPGARLRPASGRLISGGGPYNCVTILSAIRDVSPRQGAATGSCA